MNMKLSTNLKFKRMFVNILSIFVILAMALSGTWTPASAAFPGNNGKIAFMSNRDSNFEIYVMQSDGSSQTNLTNNPAYDGSPAWSPDGSQIAFTSDRDGNFEIYLMNADGTDQVRLTTDPSTDLSPHWSPDGSQIVFARYDMSVYNYDIWRMNSDGTGLVQLTDNPTEDIEPRWSPDGTKIAFRTFRDGNMEIYMMNPDGTDQINLTNHPAEDGEPDWSPDGSKIAFASTRDGYNAIWVMNADGTEPTRLTDAVYGDGHPAWSPDGSRIVFKGSRDFNDEIYVMSADGTDVTRLTNNAPPGNTLPEDWFPDWQPIIVAANPRIVVSITHDWFRAEQFSPGGTLNVKIYDHLGGDTVWEENRTADGSGFIFVGEWEHPVDLKPGNYLVISDGLTTKDLVLEAVTLDAFDPSADYLAGTVLPALGGRPVWVGTGNDQYGCGMEVIADPVSGAWEADFSAQSCDVTEDMWAAAQIFDEDGDASEGNLPRIPVFTVFPEWEVIEGWGWTQDAIVHLEIDDPTTEQSPDHSQDAQVVPTPWNPNDIWLRFDFAGVYDVKPRDVVTLSEGDTTRTHTVQNLAITGVNEVEDTVTGTVDEGVTVYVWPHATGQQVEVMAGSGGAWDVDFTGIFDLVPGECGRSEVRDADGNATGVDWCVPNPHFSAFPEWDSIEGWEWTLDTMIHMTINDPATEANPDYEQDQPVVVTPWDPNGRWVQFNFNGQYDMKVGDVITLTDGVMLRTHTVRNLSITNVDEDTNIVSGTADEGETIYVWPHATGQQVEAIVDPGGTWEVNFTGIFDLVPGEGGRSEIHDEFGNATAVDWYIPNPRMVIFPEWEWFDGLDWPDGAEVSITVEGKQECSTTKESWGYFFNGSFGEGCNIVFGDLVTLTDGITARTHTVQNLSVTEVDKEADTVAGAADAGAQIYVWPHATGEQVQVTADSTGAWQVDLTGIFDLVFGEGGRSEIRDEVGNSTAVDWDVPRPYDIYVFDTVTRQIRQVTNSPDTHEFNPRWSPDGKKIVHDMWYIDGSSHGIHITDVQTGVTQLLAGAEGGSYPTWSPNGKWIAFDRGADEDYRLFIVPPAGDDPKLVVEDAFMATWAPNSKRLAFHRPSDGGIWTTGLNGENQTKVAERGNGPAWSPDGEWIAFEVDGNVWKVRVNNDGNPLGDPIQLTSSPAWEGRPTWSNNSKTIAFHAGMGQDTDIWTIPASGGTATWLTGAPAFGDYDANYSFNGQYIAYSSFSPDGQAARSWVAVYKLDIPAGTWAEGEHNYYFGDNRGHQGDSVPFTASSGAPLYAGYALLRGAALWANDGNECINISVLNPEQATRFHSGWPTEEPTTYEQAVTYFSGLAPWIVWDGGEPVDFSLYEIRPFSPDTWQDYFCTFTE